MKETSIIYTIEARQPVEPVMQRITLYSSDPSKLVASAAEAVDHGVKLNKLILTASHNHINRFDLDSPLRRLKDIKGKFRLEIEVGDNEISRLFLWRGVLQRFHTLIYLSEPSSMTLLDRMTQLTKMGFGIKLDPTCIFGESFDTVIDYYFHTPELKCPVEPIHTLFQTWLKGKGSDLGDIFDETPGKYIYYIQDGRQTLSRRWAAGGLMLSDTELAKTKWELFQVMPQCATCRSYRICGGMALGQNPMGTCDQMNHLSDSFNTIAIQMAEDVKDVLSNGE